MDCCSSNYLHGLSVGFGTLGISEAVIKCLSTRRRSLD